MPDRIISEPQDIAQELNLFFQSVFTKSASNAQLEPYALRLPMPQLTISEEGIFSLLENLDLKKSPGPDNITNSFLNRYAVWVAKYLHKIFVTSLESATLPDDWRSANIIPIHKSGSRFELNISSSLTNEHLL